MPTRVAEMGDAVSFMAYPQNGRELLEKFGDISRRGYKEPTFLTDTKAGFSVQKNYPKDIQYKPAKTISGKDDEIACIWVTYESTQEKKGVEKVPIRLRIATMSKYRIKHGFDEDPNDEDRPTPSSGRKPMELTLRDGYFYDGQSDRLVDAKGNAVNGHDMLDDIFNEHCKSVHPIRGLGLRGRKAAHDFSRGWFDYSIVVLKFILKEAFGRTLNEDRNRSVYFDGYALSSFGKLPQDSIEIFGYKVAKRIFITFAVVFIFITYEIYPINDNSYISMVYHSEAIITIYSIILLLLLDSFIPFLLFMLVNMMIALRKRYLMHLTRN